MPDQLLRICAAVEREKKEPEHHGLRLQFAIVAVLGDGGELGMALECCNELGPVGRCERLPSGGRSDLPLQWLIRILQRNDALIKV